jgi:uncharacterized protein YbaA (DUF1428 family)
MARYVDGYVIPLKKSRVKDYLRQARLGAKIWKDHGALAYHECVAEHLDLPFGRGFRRMAGVKAGETVVFSWIVFRSRAHRDRVNAKAINDPRMQEPFMLKAPPFDVKRMAVAGFEELVGW